ncbi:mitochondrial import inner membrane translocase subunit TIM44-like [Aphidius gifuensis]|uniref:mitochondrial import inner membrane translocase subunit TIM44-like n=1 Tax=Aphidius gifuensis TaxID=684658 RepID=UPI001CDB4AAF|nr:mitochondrial import inner membrane translocase subunit TIM44-like [Aphidius gifuensis]
MHSIKLINSNGALSITQNQQVLLSSSSIYKTTRYYSNQARRPNFISQFSDNMKQEMQKNKEMKESLKKIREETEKLEQSDALKSARQKFHTVESETSKSSDVLKEKLDTLKEKVQGVIDEAGKTELGKKADDSTKTAMDTASTIINEKTQSFSKTNGYKKISSMAEVILNKIDNDHYLRGRVYTPLKKLRKRKEIIEADEKIYEVNNDAAGVELHKDSKFYKQWEDFKNNNPYVNKMLDWKIKYDTSENLLIHVSRLITDDVKNVMGGLFGDSELSKTLTEIRKTNPSFDRTQFLHDCRADIIPNILEAMMRGELEILKDWCHESSYHTIAQPLLKAKKLGYKLDNKILDIDNVDLLSGKVMEEHGPVLTICFESQQIICIRDAENNVIKGDPDEIISVNHKWVLSHDNSEINPKAAWRLLEFKSSSDSSFASDSLVPYLIPGLIPFD